MAVGPAELSVAVLGPLTVAVDGAEVVIPAGNQRRLLASLLLGRGRVVSRSRIVEDVWGLDPPDGIDAALHTTVARLRRSLGHAGARLGTDPGGYALVVAERSRDDERFRRLLADARDVHGAHRVTLLGQALDLWRGDAWQEFRDDLAAAEARQLDQLRWQARGQLAEALVGAERLDEAVNLLRDLLVTRPLHEGTVGLLVDALDRSGAVDEALATYDDFRARLAEQMGLDPSPRLVRLQARVLRREGTEPTSPPPAGTPPAGGPPTRAPVLVGRADLLGQLAERAVPGSLVTLVGPGGVGKTAVAAAFASGVDPSWWVDVLAVEREADLVELVLARTGGREGAGADSGSLLDRRLAAARGLLVLDNCEHVADGAAGLVERVLRHGSAVSVLATSRRRLGVTGERIVPVPPLRVAGGPADPPAVALFLQRATEAAPGFVADDEARRAATAICRRLDGLPLAIELAAGQAGSVSLGDLATHLTTQVDLVHATGRDRHERPRRHRTLRETMRWSYDLLDPVDQQVFRGLGVFAAEFELAAAQRVVSALGVPPGRVAVGVAELVRRSMVVAPPASAPGRYRLLETLRVHARELADTEEQRALADARAAWVRRVVAEAAHGLRGPSEPEWARRMTALLPDVRAVFGAALAEDPRLAEDLAVSLGRWGYVSLNSELLGLSERVLERQPAPSAAVLVFAGSAAWLRGDYRTSAERARRALAAPDAGPPVRHLAHEALGDAAVFTGDPAAAHEHFRVGTDLALRAGRLADAAEIGAGLALTRTYAGEDGTGEAEDALEHARLSQNPSALAFAWYAVGEVYGDGRPDAALAAFERARQVDVGPVASLAHSVAITSAAALLGRVGPLTGATFRQLADAVEHWTAQGQTGFLVTCLRNTVPLLVRAGEDEVALQVGEALARTPTQHASYGQEAELVRRWLGEAARRSRSVPTPGGWLDLVEAAGLVVRTLRARAATADAPAPTVPG